MSVIPEVTLKGAAQTITERWRRTPHNEKMTVTLIWGSGGDGGADFIRVKIEDPDFRLEWKVPVKGSYTQEQLISVITAHIRVLLDSVYGHMGRIDVEAGASPNLNFDQDWKKRRGKIR